MAGTINTNTVQLGDSATATQNFTLRTNVDGTATLARGNVGATTQDILTVDANGKAVFSQGMGAVPATQSMIRVHTPNGAGSTNTCVQRFLTTFVTQGTDITLTQSATLGDTFTVNTAGVYSCSLTAVHPTGNGVVGISASSTQLTTSIVGIAVTDKLTLVQDYTATGTVSCSWIGYLAAGAVVRVHTDATALVADNRSQFTITRVA